MIAQPLISHPIALIVGVLTTVDFNNQPSFATNEVHDERTYRLLSYEFLPVN